MHFISLPSAELEKINWKLPRDSRFNAEVLLKGKRGEANLFVGESYRKHIDEENFLRIYSQTHTAIEIDCSDQGLPGNDVIESWVEQAGDRIFKYCLNTEAGPAPGDFLYTEEFKKIHKQLGRNAGAVCIRVDETGGSGQELGMIKQLTPVATELSLFAEFTNPELFIEKKLKRILFNSLRDAGIGLAITDYAASRQMLHMELTAPRTMIRFVANDGDDSDYLRLDEWVTRIKKWIGAGLEELYFFISTEDESVLTELHGYISGQLSGNYG